MNDTIREVIEMLRQLGKTVEADEVQALLANHMNTIRAFEAAQQHAYAEGRKDEREAHAPLRSAAEQVLDAGHMNTEDLARLRAAWEDA